MVVLLRIRHPEMNHHLVDEGWLRYLHAQGTEVFSNVESQPITTAAQRGALQERFRATAILIRAILRQQVRWAPVCFVKLNAHAGGGDSRCEVQHMRRELAH